MRHFLLFVVCVGIMSVGTAWGAATERGFIVDYDEPSTNADGTALDDLAGTNIIVDVVGDGQQATVITVAATVKAGGGAISHVVCQPVADDATATHINISVAAFDEAGNQSPPSTPIAWPVAGTRDCQPPDVTAPATPQNVTVR